MNKICVVGRVSQDVEVKEFNGRNVANFNVAAQNKRKEKEENGKPVYGTNFYRVSAWGQAADVASKYLRKGHRVGLVGDLVIREYVGSDQIKHSAIEINNAEIELIETKAEAEAKLAVSAGNTGATAAPAAAPVGQGFTAVEIGDELPF